MTVTIIVAVAWFAAAVAVCWLNHRARLARPPDPAPYDPFVADDGTVWAPFLPPCPPPTRTALPDDSPLYLEGFDLDARYYAVLADAWQPESAE